jgi:hypothetical protein
MLFNTNNNDDCSICLSKLSKLVISSKSHTLSCNHTYHKNCIDEWFKNNSTCPLCRTNITIIQQKVQPPSLEQPLNITINIPIIIKNQNSNNKTKKIIKIISLFLYSLFILFHIGSAVYYYYQSHRINSNINNYIKTLNETELGDHNNNTYSEEILLISDIVYYMMFFLTNIIVLKNVKDCCCNLAGSCAILTAFIIANLIIHSQFNVNTNSYLNDKELNFDLSYSKDLDLAILLYYCSYVSELIVMVIIFFTYHNYIN